MIRMPVRSELNRATFHPKSAFLSLTMTHQMAEELSLQNLTLEDVKNQCSQPVRDVLLFKSVQTVKGLLSSKPSGLLVTGADRETRRAIVKKSVPGINIISACTCVAEGWPSDELLAITDVVCLDDLDFPEAVIEAFLKGLFPVMMRKRIIIGLASADGAVPIALRRSGRFEVFHRITAPATSERRIAWQNVVQTIRENHPTFPYPSNAVEELAVNSPSYGLHDFTKVIETLVARDAMQEKTCPSIITYEKLNTAVSEYIPIQSAIDLSFVSASSAFKPSKKKKSLMVQWGNHVGYLTAKRELKRLAEWPILHAEAFARLGVRAPRGMLLHGPHGCGKSLLAETFVGQLVHSNWLWVAGNDLFCKYLGESEARVRALFASARDLAPCVIVIDDLDIVAPARDPTADVVSGSSGVERRVLAALLTELDGIVESDVFLLACARRVDKLDPALMRPGRLDQIVRIDLPSEEDRVAILNKLLESAAIEGSNIAKQTIINSLTCATAGMSGAEISGICRDAAMQALEEEAMCQFIKAEHFFRALNIVNVKRTPAVAVERQLRL